MRSVAAALLYTAPLASAFPFLGNIEGAFDGAAKVKRQFPQDSSNCGSQPCLVFNAKDQYVDVTDGGNHPFVKPGAGDIRGPCPGLNAAANHGFLPRNGLTSISQTVDGLGQLYNMSPDLAAGLAVIAVALTGDSLTQTWSIGGAFPANPLSGLLSTPGGISNSHNKYESDASIFRGDAYLNGGNGNIMMLDKFEHFYNMAETYGFSELREQQKYNHDRSVNENPYFFAAPFAGLVAPAAHQFVANFMSNHSAENPEGTLTRDILKQFFAVTGEPGSFQHQRGQERVPLNWYRRPTSDQHSVAKVFADLAYTASKYPDVIAIGGNTGTTNSFTGVNIGDLTGGVFNAQDLSDPNKLGCFFFQGLEAVLPDQLAGLVGNVGPVAKMVSDTLGPITAGLDCPQLNTFNQGLFNQFPGYKYKPSTQSK